VSDAFRINRASDEKSELLLGALWIDAKTMAAEYRLDVGQLCVGDISVVSGPRRSEAELLESATKAATLLNQELRRLDVITKKGKFEGTSELVKLPLPLMRLPREKSAPKPKPLTAWQKFALKKGIALNRKKTNRVFDEEKQEWKDKWGKRAREDREATDWIREVKPSYVANEPGGDPFLDERRAKQARLETQKKNQEHNRRRTERMMGETRSEMTHLNHTINHLNTASNGKFDKAAVKARRAKQ